MFLENQHIRMISEGSRDTEDWSNDADNSDFHHINKLHFKIYYNRKQVILNCNNISQYHCIFEQICSFGEHSFKNIKILHSEKKIQSRHWGNTRSKVKGSSLYLIYP